MLSRDALASVDGARIIIDCVLTENMKSCGQYVFGGNAQPTGGILGRADAVFASIEALKSSGSLRAHIQAFVQYIHQLPLNAKLQRPSWVL